MGGKNGISIHHPKTKQGFERIHNSLTRRGFVAIDHLSKRRTGTVSLGDKDPSANEAQSMATSMSVGAWSNGPLAKVAWQFDTRDTNSVEKVYDQDGKTELGLGYVNWGPGNNIPSVIPPLAQSSPYTAAPLRYIADTICGLGPVLMFRMPDGKLVDFKDAGQQLRDLGMNAAAQEWNRTWYGEEVTDALDIKRHRIGIKEFLEENNLNLHMSQCMQDDVMLDIYFPTVGFDYTGTRGVWQPLISQVSFLPAHSTRLERQNETRHINHCYFSDRWRTLGPGTTQVVSPDQMKTKMFPACMPQHLLHDLRYLVSDNQKTSAKRRPMWVVCPTFYPSLNKPYYPQPAWWSVFTSKAFDFSATILYDKYKQRENKTSWGRIMYISLDYLNEVFAGEGFVGNKKAQDEFLDELEASMEDFLQHRENQGKYMRQWKWEGKDGKEHYNVEIVDVKDAIADEVKAGKDELELSTSPIFLALQVDPRLVGVPMVAASNGGTALREMALLKQQQLSPKQRLYENFLNAVLRFNGWDNNGCAEFHIKQQTFTTLDNSKTGIVETISGENT